MFPTFISAMAGAAAQPSLGASSSTVMWMLLQVFIAMCLTFAGLAWFAKRKL
jgi:hypothetical protein